MMSILSTTSVLMRCRRHGDCNSCGNLSPHRVNDWSHDCSGSTKSKTTKGSEVSLYSMCEGRSPNKETYVEKMLLQDNVKQQVLGVEWDRVNRETEQRELEIQKRCPPNVSERSMSISFLDAVRSLKRDTDAWEPYMLTPKFGEESDINCLRSLFRWCTCGRYSRTSLSGNGGSDSSGGGGGDMDPEYTLQRDAEFCLTLPSVPFEHNHSVHHRLLVTIHNALLHPIHSSRNGSSQTAVMDWEKLGFQGNDPATDLRSTGIFGLLQLVYLLEYYRDFTNHLWDTCTNGGNGVNVLEELPFVLIGFNFSDVVLDALTKGPFHADMMRCARNTADAARKSSYISNMSDDELALRREFPFLVACCEYHVGCLFLFWQWWLQLKQQRGGRPPTIGDFGVVKAKLCAKIKKNGAQHLLDACSRARDTALLLSLCSETTAEAGGKPQCDAVRFSSI